MVRSRRTTAPGGQGPGAAGAKADAGAAPSDAAGAAGAAPSDDETPDA